VPAKAGIEGERARENVLSSILPAKLSYTILPPGMGFGNY
jgi:hypothetical protein